MWPVKQRLPVATAMIIRLAAVVGYSRRDYECWRKTTLQDIENNGHQETLNCLLMLGAMAALGGRKPQEALLAARGEELWGVAELPVQRARPDVDGFYFRRHMPLGEKQRNAEGDGQVQLLLDALGSVRSNASAVVRWLIASTLAERSPDRVG
jgi:hypothetical protein